MPDKKFIIFGQGRSGSNLLRILLNSHPEVFCENEILYPDRLAKSNYYKRLKICWFPLCYIFPFLIKCEKKVFGIKILDFHHPFVGNIVKNLYKKGWKIIHIQRRNVLKQALSGIIAKKTNINITNKAGSLPTGVYHLSPERFMAESKSRKKRFGQEQEILSKIPHHEIVYEDHLQIKDLWQNASNKIFDFLGIKSQPLVAKTEITDTRPDWERIGNFDEIITFFMANGHNEHVENYYNNS